MGNPTLSPQNVTVKPAKKPIAKPRSNSRFFLQFAKRHPFFCLLLVWSSMLFFGWLAIKGLTYINPDPLEVAQSPQPEAVTQPNQVESDSPATSFGLLAIVAVSCAASSVFLARQLRPVKPAPRRVATRPTVRPAEPVRRQPRPTIAKSQPNLRPIAKPIPQPAKPSIVPPARTVTILSVEDENSIEFGEPTLADMLDIRQQARG